MRVQLFFWFPSWDYLFGFSKARETKLAELSPQLWMPKNSHLYLHTFFNSSNSPHTHFLFSWNRHWHQSPSFCRNISQCASSSPDRYRDDAISPAIILEWKYFDKSKISKAFVHLILPNLCTENMLQQIEIQERKEWMCEEEGEWFKQKKGHREISLEIKNSHWPKGHLDIEGELKTSRRRATKKLFCMKILIPLAIMHWNKRCKTVLQQKAGASCRACTQLRERGAQRDTFPFVITQRQATMSPSLNWGLQALSSSS